MLAKGFDHARDRGVGRHSGYLEHQIFGTVGGGRGARRLQSTQGCRIEARYAVGTAEEVSLQVFDPELEHERTLLAVLDSLGDDPAAGDPAHVDERAEDLGAHGIPLDTCDEVAV